MRSTCCCPCSASVPPRLRSFAVCLKWQAMPWESTSGSKVSGLSLFRDYGLQCYRAIHTYGQTDRQTDRQTDKQTDRQPGRQADRQTSYMHAYVRTYTCIHKTTHAQTGLTVKKELTREIHRDSQSLSPTSTTPNTQLQAVEWTPNGNNNTLGSLSWLRR